MFWIILIAAAGVVTLVGVLVFLVGERGLRAHASTREFIQAGGARRFLNLSTLHGYIYMRWQKAYIRLFVREIGPRSSQSSRKWWADQYHGKILTDQQAKTLVSIKENIPYQNLEQVIPYPIARDIVLSAPPQITVYQCGCRLARENPCTPTQVCMFIGEPFASFMLEHHPAESKALSQAEALELLQSEHERGHVHTAWFKNAMHDRFYVICNCCKCCCGGIETMNRYGIPMMASSGYIARVDETLCAGCGTCVDTCPFEALSVERTAITAWEKCMGCGVCVEQCPNGALALVRDERKGQPLEVKAPYEDAVAA